MNEHRKVDFWYSWPVIILAICVFWPIGVFLLIKRFSVDKKAAVGMGGKGMSGLGIGLVIFGAIRFIDSVSSPYVRTSSSVLALFFVAGGVVLIFRAKKLKKQAENIKQYLSIVVNGNVRQLDAIVSKTGKSYDVVYKDIKNMINRGYLKNAYIDEGLREIVFPNDARTSHNNVNTVSDQAKVVACPCCGANNTIYGGMGECEYCGSPLK